MKTGRNLRWEQMEKGNIELRQLIQHFEVFNRSEGKSPRTVKWYSDVLNLLLRWLESETRPTRLEDIGENEIRAFILHLQDKKMNGKPLSSHTIANRVRGIRGFFSWLAAKGYTEDHVLRDVRLPKTAQTVIEPLTAEEIELLFSSINENTALGSRNVAILALFLDTGLRLSELVNLREEEVHLDQRYVKVMGKGSKERMVPLGSSCQKALLHYYHHFRPEPAHAGVEAFFLTLDGYPMDAEAVTSMLDRLAKKTGIKRLHAHLLRHTYATRFLLNGGDVFLLKQNLGHSTLAMVEHYRHIASREAALMSETFSPLDRMNLKKLRRYRNNHDGSYGAVYPNAGQRRNNLHVDLRLCARREAPTFSETPRELQSRRASSRGRSRRKA
jgi:integrase/recombinase XerC/integrase/recombinase XerD